MASLVIAYARKAADSHFSNVPKLSRKTSGMVRHISNQAGTSLPSTACSDPNLLILPFGFEMIR
jgi:hypothetical protein